MFSPKLHFRRFEFKYHLSPQIADRICNDLLNNNMDWDPYALKYPEKEYLVTSLYFDSPKLKCYHEKIDGLKSRFKLRLRIYKKFLEEGDNVFLEIKRKSDMVVSKDRVILPFGLFKNFSHGEGYLDPLLVSSKRDRKTLKEFFWKKNRYCMRPLIYVRYNRKPLMGKFRKRFRVTFDSKIKSSYTDSLSSCGGINEVNPDTIIMEVKYDNTLPHWFLRIVHKYQLDRRPFSKYCSGLEACKKNNQF